MEILTGNTNERAEKLPEHRGWIVGQFLKENTPLKNDHVEIKWVSRKDGIVKKGSESTTPRHTIAILIRGKLQFSFPSTGKKHTLENEGDYVYYDTSEGPHSSLSIGDTVAIIIRWPSVSA